MKKKPQIISQCLLIAIILFCKTSLFAQNVIATNSQIRKVNKAPLPTQSVIHPLTIGDKVPDITIENIINYPSQTINLSALKGKLVILDFWEISCTNCIRALPKIESLQKKYKNQIQVLTITKLGSQEQILNTLQRIPVTRNLKLPIALNNSLLRKYFPFEFTSHVIWIDGNGIIKAITGTDYIDEKNIRSILNGEKIDWPIKKDIPEFNENLPLLDFASQDNIVRPGFIYYSGVIGHIDGIDALKGMIVDSVHGTITRNYFNMPIVELCELILSGYAIYTNPKKLILEVKDTSRYLFNPDKDYRSDWENKNTYCYSLTLPLGISQEKTAGIIKSDLSRWLNILFDLTVKKENRKIKCLALIRTRNDDKLIATKGGKPDNNLDNNDSVKSLSNFWFSALSGFLQQNVKEIPYVVDATGIPYNKNIDIELKIRSFQNISVLRKELQRYGLDLIPVEREMEVYVITEKGFANTTANNKELH